MEIIKTIRKDKKNSKDHCPIRITAYWEGKRAFFSTGQTCHIDHWDEKNAKVKSKDSYYIEKNRILSQLVEKITDELYKARTNGETITSAELKKRVEGVVAINPTFNKKSWHTHWQDFINYKTRDVSTVTSYRISPVTIQGYKQAYDNLVNFEKYHYQIDLEKLDKAFYNDFYNYALDQGLSINYFGKLISRLKTFLGYCEENEILVSKKWRKFTVTTEKKTVDSLTESEVIAIRDAKIDHKLHAIVRDMFLFACSTGVHISDLLQLTPANIHEGILHLKRTKNRLECHIPLLEDNFFCAKSMIEKYKGKQETLFPFIDRLRVHIAIKQVFRKAGVTRVAPMFKLARKTFVTILLYRGVPSRVIMQATGHSGESGFNHYAGVNLESLKNQFNTHPHTHPSETNNL